jgi:uncharacterized membrane protein
MKYKNMSLALIAVLVGFNAMMAVHAHMHHHTHQLAWNIFCIVFMLVVVNLFHFLDKDDEE